MFQPLFILDLDIYFKESREIQWIKESSFVEFAPTFNQDVVKSSQAIFLSEVLMRTLSEKEKNPSLFKFIYHSIEYLESLENASPSFHLMFLFQLSSYLGFFPRNNFSATNIFFSAPSGSFSTTPSSTDIGLETSLGKAWNKCFYLDYMSVDQEFKSQHSRNQFLDSILHFYKVHHPYMGDLKSVDVLRTVFNG